MSETELKKTEMVDITVPVKNHTHAGERVKKDSKISVDKETAAMLEKVWKSPGA